MILSFRASWRMAGCVGSNAVMGRRPSGGFAIAITLGGGARLIRRSDDAVQGVGLAPHVEVEEAPTRLVLAHEVAPRWNSRMPPSSIPRAERELPQISTTTYCSSTVTGNVS